VCDDIAHHEATFPRLDIGWLREPPTLAVAARRILSRSVRLQQDLLAGLHSATMFKVLLNASGSLWIVPRPRGGDWLDDDIAGLARRGVEVLVSLLCEDEQIELGLEQELAACASQNVDFLSLPVPISVYPLARMNSSCGSIASCD
jgi:hypothetical protein